MTSSHVAYLESLQRVAKTYAADAYGLWPRTPISAAIQDKIRERVGATDYDMSDRRSRSASVVRYLERLREAALIPVAFSVLDVACGDAVVLWQIKRAFPPAACYGLDCHMGDFPTHQTVQQDGVQLYRGFIQHMFATPSDVPFDVVLMLNTYRGWTSADLRKHEHDLPERADQWLRRHARYSIVTATRSQILHLRRAGLRVIRIGKGEDRSDMVCLTELIVPSIWRGLMIHRAASHAPAS